MDGRKLPVPSCGLAIQLRTEVLVDDEVVVNISQGPGKELVCPRGDVRILRPKEGNNGHEGQNVRYKIKKFSLPNIFAAETLPTKMHSLPLFHSLPRSPRAHYFPRPPHSLPSLLRSRQLKRTGSEGDRRFDYN